MKKWLSLLLALAMALPLAACGSAGNQENIPEPPASVSGSTGEETPAPTDAETPAEEPAEEPAESETPAAEDSGSVLIAYFSATGNTENARPGTAPCRCLPCRHPDMPRTGYSGVS